MASCSHHGVTNAAARSALPVRGLGIAPVIVAAGISAAVTGITALLQSIRMRGMQKVGATNAANQAEYKLQELLAAWNASPKTRSDQAAALAAFDQVWSWLTSTDGCGNMQLGSAGQRCISERGPGGTVPGTGGNWFVWYRDPIANDPAVVPDAVQTVGGTGTGAGSQTATTLVGVPGALWLAAGLVGAALLLGGD